jgi:hypothetical protein|tara:strand:+ start:428 stop:808 length:381 start_codon:yes stop_codon:yes gene_type:complete
MPYDIKSKFEENSPLPCWKGYERVPGTKKGAKGSCRKKKNKPPFSKQKGGGTKKVCLPADKVRSMSKSERKALASAKSRAGKKGKYRRSSKTNVKGARKKGATLRDWFKKENWVQVGNPKKKCGED